MAFDALHHAVSTRSNILLLPDNSDSAFYW